jgi:hypothetical protein
MAISHRASGTWVASNATTQTVTLPTHAAGDMLIVRAVRKPFTNPDNIVCNTAGWAAVATGVANGATANGNGTGSMAFKAFYKIAESNAETNPVVTWGTTSAPGAAVAISYQKGALETWITPTGNGGGDTTARTSQTSTIASHISVTAGDMVDFFRGQCDDSGALTVPTITQASVTFDTVSEQPAAALLDGTSNDIAADGGYRLATAGTSSAAAVVTGTSAASEQHGAWMTRLRVFTPETHSGSVTGTGGGVAVVAIAKQGRTAVTGTGGGVAAPVGTKQGAVTVTASAAGVATLTGATQRTQTVTSAGGGTATLAQSTARATTATATGGGAATMTYQVAESHFGSVTATGGGLAVVSAATARGETLTASGAGVATLVPSTERAGALVATAAGAATVESQGGRVGTLTATGSGEASLSVLSARLAAALMSGGGVMTSLHTTKRYATLSATGGGSASVQGEQESGGVSAEGQVTATGGGTGTVVATAGRNVSVTATGGGAISILWQGNHTGSVAATGGGSGSVEGEGPPGIGFPQDAVVTVSMGPIGDAALGLDGAVMPVALSPVPTAEVSIS